MGGWPLLELKAQAEDPAYRRRWEYEEERNEAPSIAPVSAFDAQGEGCVTTRTPGNGYSSMIDSDDRAVKLQPQDT